MTFLSTNTLNYKQLIILSLVLVLFCFINITMITESEVIIGLIVHLIADFFLQTKNMAMKKSYNNYWLTTHVGAYSSVWLILMLVVMSVPNAIGFTLVTFLIHWITDFTTSKITSKMYKAERFYKLPGFFDVIGIDQVLHYIQLLLTYQLFKDLVW